MTTTAADLPLPSKGSSRLKAVSHERPLCGVLLRRTASRIGIAYLFERTDSAPARMEKVRQVIGMAWDTYPDSQKDKTQIVHVSRSEEGVGCKFFYQEHILDPLALGILSSAMATAPSGEISKPLLFGGTGGGSVENSIESWNRRYKSRHTSRAMFAAFCESILSDEDPHSGGAPQLVGLYRIGAGRSFGVIWNNARYFDGQKTLSKASKDNVAWRNDTFEVVDQSKKKRLPGTSRHFKEFDFAGTTKPPLSNC
ncbi:TPA: hypothetical protein VDU83_006725 [Pseudomonas aeruginosa]|nr:hypothetical protein [Pseudomonas aeruginosa]